MALERRPHSDAILESSLDEVLVASDPNRANSLLEAMADPGEYDFSTQARERFVALADELRQLRRHAGDPVADLTQRVVTSLGLEVELAIGRGAPGTGGTQLAAFVQAVADYSDIDGEAFPHRPAGLSRS